ncbi:MAG: porin [Proteobacteria bacterium]|nr:porin [Pseudomonadota bacterium]
MMKKTLLATTALISVAYAGSTLAQESMVMAPQGTDASLGGFYEFGYNSFSQSAEIGPDNRTLDESRTYGDSELFLSFSRTSDAGLEYGMDVQMEIVNGGESVPNSGGQGDVDEASMYIAGPFGRFVIGNNDPASDSFLTWLGTAGSYGQDDVQNGLPDYIFRANGNRVVAESDGTNYLNARAVRVKPFAVNPSYDDGSKIAYFSPDLDGFRFGASWEDTGDEDDDISYGGELTRGVGDWGDLTVRFAYRDDSDRVVETGQVETDESVSYGAELTLWDDIDITLGYAKIDNFRLGAPDPTDDFDHRIRTTAGGVGYQVNDRLYVSYFSAESEAKNHLGEGGDQEGEFSSISASYEFAPGLSFALSFNTFEITETVRTGANAGDKYSNEGDEVVSELEVSF